MAKTLAAVENASAFIYTIQLLQFYFILLQYEQINVQNTLQHKTKPCVF